MKTAYSAVRSASAFATATEALAAQALRIAQPVNNLRQLCVCAIAINGLTARGGLLGIFRLHFISLGMMDEKNKASLRIPEKRFVVFNYLLKIE